jgi:molybdopterin-dependent oxidoreductase alpha subunit
MTGVKPDGDRISHPPPFGSKPRYLREVLSAAWHNRTAIPYAWNILSHSVCDGCSVGSDGLREEPSDGIHLCEERLQSLRWNTMDAADPASLNDVHRLHQLKPERLRALGRLAYPMIRRRGQRGFLRVSWDDALDVIAKGVRQITPYEMAFLAAPRGLTNEVYYIFQKLARTLGTNNVAVWSGPRRANALTALRMTLGHGASTCSLSDLIGTDLVVVLGADYTPPLLTKYFRRARNAGARIFFLSPSSEAVPVAGGKSMSDSFRIRLGGASAFMNGVLKFLILAERVDQPFVENRTAGFPQLAAALSSQGWESLERRSGSVREEMQSFAEAYSRARSAVFICAEDCDGSNHAEGVKSLVNLMLARGMVGREKCGVMLIHGQSGDQGSHECGVAPDIFPGGFAVKGDAARRFSNLWHHPVSSQPGLDTPAITETAHEGRIKLLYSLGANGLETSPHPEFMEAALSRVPLRVHQDIALDTSMLIEAGETVVLLPAQTRHEQRTGGISTSNERRIRFTPEIPGHHIGESLPAWEIPIRIARRSMSNGDKLFPFDNTRAIREEMSRVMPIYQAVESLNSEGDQLQWGDTQLYKDGFTNMPQGRALFTVLDPLDGQIASIGGSPRNRSSGKKTAS